ncbi:MAG: DoxX-like family protein [Acidimicrobiia bacterium]|nr:DoxX-like family protein [Acidimicrobiia bacterium]
MRVPMEQLWDATQDPDEHQRWDVRFGSITYLPKMEGEPQRFTYATTVAPGVTVGGTGESLGDRDRPDGTRWSGLRFWAKDRRSIIDAGAGYWRYVPTDDGIRFLTRYDYRPRWGRLGELVDRVVFRPAFGWATAWSFDRLRLWLEEGIPPERSRDQAIAHATAVGGLVGVFAYQGLVPKVWKVDQDEVAIWQGLGLSGSRARKLVRTVGAVEAGFAVATAARSGKRWPFVIAMAAMPTLAIGAATSDRSILTKAFNPGSLGIAVAALAGVALATRDGRPSGRRPLRTAPDRQPDVEELP